MRAIGAEGIGRALWLCPKGRLRTDAAFRRVVPRGSSFCREFRLLKCRPEAIYPCRRNNGFREATRWCPTKQVPEATAGQESREAQQEDSLFPVVAIGASAGGLEAFTGLLRQLPADTGTAFVFIQHMAPSHESMLPQLLARETAMPVSQIEHGALLSPNHVYVIPPNAAGLPGRKRTWRCTAPRRGWPPDGFRFFSCVPKRRWLN